MSKLFPCGGRKSETQAKHDTKAKPPKGVDVPSYLFQVSNSEGKILQSSNSKLHQTVHVVDASAEKEMWELERDGKESLWSYHVKSPNGQKLFVCYDAIETTDESVSLELADSGKERYFIALAQPSGGFLLAAINDVERILWVKNDELAMVPASQVSSDVGWFQTVCPDIIIKDTAYFGQIEKHGSNEKWKSADARPQDYISLTTHRKQEWSLDGVFEQWKFKTVNPQTNEEYYASGTDASATELVFETNVTRVNLREFSVNRNHGTPGLIIQSMSNSRYVGMNGDYLQLEEKKEQAVGWEFVISGFMYKYADGNHVIFPAL